MNKDYYITPANLEQLIQVVEKHSLGGGLKDISIAESTFSCIWPKIDGMEPVLLTLQNNSKHSAGLLWGYYQRYAYTDEQTGQINDRYVVMLLQNLTRFGEPAAE